MVCPSDDILPRFLSDADQETSSTDVMSHVMTCTDCQGRISTWNQKPRLDAINKAAGKDVFVATPMGFSKKNIGIVQTAATWTQTVRTLLPKTDVVMFIAGGEKPRPLGMAPWVRVEEVMGDRMTPQGLYPERYLVETFPNDAEIAALKLETP